MHWGHLMEAGRFHAGPPLMKGTLQEMCKTAILVSDRRTTCTSFMDQMIVWTEP